MQCALAADKLYKKEERRMFSFSSYKMYAPLFQNTPILEQNPSIVAIDNIARHVVRNQWPVKE